MNGLLWWLSCSWSVLVGQKKIGYRGKMCEVTILLFFFTFPKVHLAQKDNDFVKVFSQAANGRIGNKLSLAF